MINPGQYRQFLLKTLPFAQLQQGGDEVVCKCRYCPDNGDHYHMYVSIPSSNKELSYFNCFKCHTGGAVTSNRLMEWGCFDPEWISIISEHNREAVNMCSNLLLEIEDHIYNTIVVNSDSELSKSKLNYVNQRLGLNLSIQEATDNGIVLDLISTLRANNISKITRDPRILKEISDNFVGFITFDKAYVNMRNLTEPGTLFHTIDEKYVNYNIYGKKNSSMKFITFPTYIDSSLPVELHVGEGPFDALSIKYNLRGNAVPNAIYAAVTGNAYKGLIKHMICTLGIMNMNIHLYLDSDEAGKYMLNDLLYDLQMYMNPIWIHYNTIGKDMGVKKEQIKESIERIK